MPYPTFPTCPTCGTALVKYGKGFCEWECPICDSPQEEESAPYINHCWYCGEKIDSRDCEPSPFINGGFICNNCGRELTEFYGRPQIPVAVNLGQAHVGGSFRGGHPRPLSR